MRALLLLPAFALSACADFDRLFDEPGRGGRDADAAAAAEAGDTDAVQTAVLAAPPPPPAARTVEQFDTTTPEQRAAAAAVPDSGGELLGTTIASLGDPSRPGFWTETPLVGARATGRLVYPVNGNSVEVELIPLDGPDGAGSRVSLPAYRVLEAPLTDLPTLEVYAN